MRTVIQVKGYGARPGFWVENASKRRLEVTNALSVFVPSASVIVVGYTFFYFVSSGGIEIYVNLPFFVRNDSRWASKVLLLPNTSTQFTSNTFPVNSSNKIDPVKVRLQAYLILL